MGFNLTRTSETPSNEITRIQRVNLPSRIDNSPLGGLRGDGAEVKANLGSGIRRIKLPLHIIRSKDNVIGSSDQRLRGPR